MQLKYGPSLVAPSPTLLTPLFFRMSVSVRPGRTLLHRMPSLPYIHAVFRLTPKRACFAAVYATPAAGPRVEATEQMFMMTPLRSCFKKNRDASSREIHGTVDVDGKDSLPYGIAELAYGFSAVHDAGAVDQYIEVTPFLHDCVDGSIDLLLHSDVALDVNLRRSDFILCVAFANVQYGYSCTLRPKQGHSRQADAARSTCDQGNFLAEHT